MREVHALRRYLHLLLTSSLLLQLVDDDNVLAQHFSRSAIIPVEPPLPDNLKLKSTCIQPAAASRMTSAVILQESGIHGMYPG